MSTKTRICNKALSHLGSSVEIGAVETERSAEAAACRMFFDDARQETLSAWPWPFATKFEALALLETSPNEEWAFSYRYPADCLDFRRILSGSRNDTRYTRVPMKIGSDGIGGVIFTDKENAEAEFGIDILENFNLFSPKFEIALSYRLASFIAPRVTGGDPFKMGDKALAMFRGLIEGTKAGSANEEQPDPDPESEFITTREGILPSWTPQNS